MKKVSLCVLIASLTVLTAVGSAAETPDNAVSGARSMDHVRALVRFGPRVPGTEPYWFAQRYIIRHLRLAFAEIEEVDFAASTPRGIMPMKNIIGRFPGKSNDVVVLAGHYDTLNRPGFVGANDSGSSAALLLELARVIGRRKNALTVWVVFFDGEEAFEKWGARDSLYGSRYQVRAWQHDEILEKIRAFILVDMIGDKNLGLQRDYNSTAWLRDLVWEVARDRGHGSHFLQDSIVIEDDHVPFVVAGVPAVDLIDYDYSPRNSFWHTQHDTVDKLSPRSFEVVGGVVLAVIKRLEERTAQRGQ